MVKENKIKIIIVGTKLGKTSYYEKMIEKFKLQNKIEISKLNIDDKISGLKPNMVIIDDIENVKIFSMFKDGREVPVLETKKNKKGG